VGYTVAPSGQIARGGVVVTLPAAEIAIWKTRVHTALGSAIAAAAAKAKVAPAWIEAIVYAESAGNPAALRIEPSGQTGVGLMQITDPGLKAGHTDAELMDPGLNLAIGTAFVARLVAQGNADLVAVASAYNCGPGADGRAKPSTGNPWGLCAAAGYLDRVAGAANAAIAAGVAATPGAAPQTRPGGPGLGTVVAIALTIGVVARVFGGRSP
jgi:soluble lytic murein transglycosylase-like protein